MHTSSRPSVPALVAGFVLLAGCGGRGGVAVDGGGGVADAPPGNIPDGMTTTAGGDSDTKDASSAISPDTLPVKAGAGDGSAGDADRGYLPADSPDGSVPDCIWTLLQQCCGSPTELCVVQIWDSGIGAYICWPTGELNIADDHGTITGYASDGTVCYTQKLTLVNGTDPGVAFSDSTGQQVATYRYIHGSEQVEVACDGATFLATPPFTCVTAIGNCKRGICPI